MKTILATFSAVAILCAAMPTMAYTPKSEATMKQEWAAKWKADAKKVAACFNGKKGYAARMKNKAAAITKPKKMATKKTAA